MQIDKIVCKNDRLLVEPVDIGDQMHGNIYMPDAGKERPEIGIIIDVGPGRQSEFGSFINTTLEVGQYVLIPKIGSIRIEVDNKEYYIVPEKEVLATITLKEESTNE